MSSKKDQSLLKLVSKYFTEETLENILCTLCNGRTAEILSWDFGQASAKGDGYLSDVHKIKITGKVDGVEKQVGIVVKSFPKNIGRRKTFRTAEFFQNEIKFYTKVLPEFQKFLKAKGQSKILCVPRYLGSLLDGENDFIAMEDVSLLGFGPVSRQNCIEPTECALLLKTMAKFHAISFAYKDQKPNEFSEIIENLQETYIAERLWPWYKRYYTRLTEVAEDAISKEYPDSVAEKKFKSLSKEDLYKKCSEFCRRIHAPTSVVSHGDSWAPNFLSKTTAGEEEALILDFQLARCASPVLDIALCMYACTDKKLRDEFFDQMLKMYHDELTKTISILGSDPQKLYPWNTFMNEVQEQFVGGFLIAVEAIPFSVLDESDVVDLDAAIKGDEAADLADVWIVSNIKSKSGRQRLADIIVHATERGYI